MWVGFVVACAMPNSRSFWAAPARALAKFPANFGIRGSKAKISSPTQVKSCPAMTNHQPTNGGWIIWPPFFRELTRLAAENLCIYIEMEAADPIPREIFRLFIGSQMMRGRNKRQICPEGIAYAKSALARGEVAFFWPCQFWSDLSKRWSFLESARLSILSKKTRSFGSGLNIWMFPEIVVPPNHPFW